MNEEMARVIEKFKAAKGLAPTHVVHSVGCRCDWCNGDIRARVEIVIRGFLDCTALAGGACGECKTCRTRAALREAINP